MDGRKRTVQIKFRVTEAERDLILEKMKLVPTRNMAAYLRKIAIDGYIVQVDHTDIKAMTAEIQKIGVNVNQIAKRVNSTGSVYQEDITPCIESGPEQRHGWKACGAKVSIPQANNQSAVFLSPSYP